MTRTKLAAVVALAAGPVLLGTGTATADAGGTVALSGTSLVYQAGGERNTVILRHLGTRFVFDDSVEVQTGPGCWHPSAADLTLVECDDSGVTTVVVYAGGGDDVVSSTLASPTILWGQAGDDHLYGGPGDDILRGDGGEDHFSGGGGRDGVTYYGYATAVEADIDSVSEDDGVPGEGDTIWGDVEDLYGGEGGDTLTGNGNGNAIVGNGGNDTIDGLGGPDYLSGSNENDWIHGGSGDDTVHGGPGDDRLWGDGDVDHLNGGVAGDDWLFGSLQDTCVEGELYVGCQP
ncbi:calcium-binding protein [Saccharothrix sp. BKS2]|uniref:calcium-binding protein n=1 Tax=Saccharothrix sp. BKS2 TaxID=3064400 RepID=UPI0039E9D23A